MSFAAFEKALDGVDRATTWRNMRSYDIPEKIVKMMVETLYNASAVGISLFIKSILKSLVILAIWLALRGAIYSRIAPFFALNHNFFSANENGIVKQNNQSDFRAF